MGTFSFPIAKKRPYFRVQPLPRPVFAPAPQQGKVICLPSRPPGCFSSGNKALSLVPDPKIRKGAP